jgi:hypothetical protein
MPFIAIKKAGPRGEVHAWRRRGPAFSFLIILLNEEIITCISKGFTQDAATPSRFASLSVRLVEYAVNTISGNSG